MAYYDQYGGRGERTTYPPQQYPEQTDTAYYPYEGNQPHRTYDQGGFGYQDQGYGAYKDEPGPSGVTKETDNAAFDNDTFVSSRTRVVEPKCVLELPLLGLSYN